MLVQAPWSTATGSTCAMPTPGKREASASASQSAVIPARVSGTLIRIGEDQFARARGHGHRGRIGVSRYERWPDGDIADAPPLPPAHAPPRIADRRIVRPHAAGPGGVLARAAHEIGREQWRDRGGKEGDIAVCAVHIQKKKYKN